MAKEAKTKTVTANFNYDGIEMTIAAVVYDYEIEEGIKDLATPNQVARKGQ